MGKIENSYKNTCNCATYFPPKSVANHPYCWCGKNPALYLAQTNETHHILQSKRKDLKAKSWVLKQMNWRTTIVFNKSFFTRDVEMAKRKNRKHKQYGQIIITRSNTTILTYLFSMSCVNQVPLLLCIIICCIFVPAKNSAVLPAGWHEVLDNNTQRYYYWLEFAYFITSLTMMGICCEGIRTLVNLHGKSHFTSIWLNLMTLMIYSAGLESKGIEIIEISQSVHQ